MSTLITDGEPHESAAARRSAPITREAVFEAADSLTKAGSRPTIERVRLYLGKGTPRGSPNTVNGFLTQWWENLTVRLAGGTVEAVQGLPPSVSGTLETLWNQALVAAKGYWQNELTKQSKSLDERAKGLETKARELTDREQHLAGQATSLETALELAREQLAAANQRAETLEATEVRRTGEIQALQEHCRSSDAEVRRLQKQFDAERTDLVHQAAADRQALLNRFEATERQWLREIEETRQIAKERAQDVKRTRAELAATVKQCDRLQRELNKAKSRSSDTKTTRRARVSSKRTATSRR